MCLRAARIGMISARQPRFSGKLEIVWRSSRCWRSKAVRMVHAPRRLWRVCLKLPGFYASSWKHVHIFEEHFSQNRRERRPKTNYGTDTSYSPIDKGTVKELHGPKLTVP